MKQLPFFLARQPSRNLRPLRAILPLLAAGLTHFCNAAGILDQSFTGANSASLVINDGAASMAQTFTVGFNGTLMGINLDVYSYYTPGNFPLHVAIRGVTGGIPNNSVLGETTLVGVSAIGMDQLITFPQTIPVTAGVQYAIVVDYAGATPQDHAQGGLWGSSVDGYLGGMPFGLYYGTTWTPFPSVDAHFRTYVEPIPEPSALCLSITMGLGLLLFREPRPSQAPTRTA